MHNFMNQEEAMKRVLKNERRKAHEEGHKEGHKEGWTQCWETRNEEVATDMLKEGAPLPQIVRISKLSEEAVRKLAESLEIAVF